MTKFLIVGSGFLMSKLPYSILGVFISFLAKLCLFFPSKRKRLLFSNLTHAFPDWSYEQIKSTGLESTLHLLEMGFFSLIYPHISRDERRATIAYSYEVESELMKIRSGNRPTLILLPHISLFEAIATSQVFRPYGGKTLGAIYRPNSNHTLDDWINKSRLDLGLKTFSRRKGLLQARKHLADGNWLALLFDQNAGLGGELSLFMNRVCSITPLPDIILRGVDANIVLATPVRQSLFRAKLEIYNLSKFKSDNISQIAHQKLESIIRKDPLGFPEWLWSHGKWKTQDSPYQIFHLHSKRTNLPEAEKIPKKTKIWIRLPNWLGDLVMTLPLIKAIMKGRPDAEITLLCQEQYEPLLKHLNIGHKVFVLPPKGFSYYMKFFALRKQYPDVHFLFTNSLRGDLEAYLCGALLRLGGSTSKKRKLLSHQAIISKEFDKKHQTELWGEYLKFFGLKQSIDFRPFEVSKTRVLGKTICLAPGSSNTPEKRWPVTNWVQLLTSLIKKLPDHEFRLIGTSNDAEICSTILNSVDSPNVYDYSGETNLVELCNFFQNSNVLICNDSGAMHLGNSLGIPIVAIFGPTDASVTGPIFISPKVLIENSSDKGSEIFNLALKSTLDLIIHQPEPIFKSSEFNESTDKYSRAKY